MKSVVYDVQGFIHTNLFVLLAMDLIAGVVFVSDIYLKLGVGGTGVL